MAIAAACSCVGYELELFGGQTDWGGTKQVCGRSSLVNLCVYPVLSEYMTYKKFYMYVCIYIYIDIYI